MKQLLVTFLLLVPAFLQAQGKSKVDFEDELQLDGGKNNPPQNPEPPKGKLKDETVVVEGEDEQLFRNQKEAAKDIKPGESDLTDWKEPADEIIKREKKGPRQVEKKAQLRAEYGSYNALGADIYVTKADEFGVYMLEYNRLKYDSEGFGRATVANSEYSSDRLTMSSGFNLSENYKMLLKASYEDYLRGLQQNPVYTQQFRRGGFFDLNNQFRPSEFQRLNVDVSAEYISSSIEENTAQRDRDTSAYWRIKGGADWQYIFGNRNALSMGGNLWYAENRLYGNTATNYYRVGEFRAKDVIPLYRTIVGEEKVPWQLDLTIGVQVTFAQQMMPVWGPIVSLDSFLGAWYSKLEFERKGSVPEMREDFLQRHYSRPVHYTELQDHWHAGWKNSFRLAPNQVLKLNGGFNFYETYFDRNYNPADGLLSARAVLFRAPYAETVWEHSPFDLFFYEMGVRGEAQLDRVTHRAPVSLFLKAHVVPNGWDFGMEFHAQSARKVPDVSAELKPFFLWHASLEKKFNPTVSAYIRAENLLNMRYILVYPYETSGFRIFGGVNIYI